MQTQKTFLSFKFVWDFFNKKLGNIVQDWSSISTSICKHTKQRKKIIMQWAKVELSNFTNRVMSESECSLSLASSSLFSWFSTYAVGRMLFVWPR